MSTSEAVAVRVLNYTLLLKTNIPLAISAACYMDSYPFFEELGQTHTCYSALGEAACEGRNLPLSFGSG